ncbi:MAG: hypothetical protein CO096_12170 [Armatimonadetes bacterium CG_4_9_14_3_um_filter_66_14]|nr:MAG: hypothetical protein CO096_12170 [Armatimonadetes bacterium CG_4_9_14_3_um_filter_66_14]
MGIPVHADHLPKALQLVYGLRRIAGYSPPGVLEAAPFGRDIFPKGSRIGLLRLDMVPGKVPATQ